MPPKTGLTRERHRQLGLDIFQKLQSIHAELYHVYPPEISGLLNIAVDALTELRHQLDEKVFREQRSDPEVLKFYYPGGHRPAKEESQETHEPGN